ncbi:MAG: methyltransferase domain-containing protein [Limisphaerales bacterium]
MDPSPIQVTRRTTCRLCDSRRLERVVPLAPTPVAEKYVTREHLDESTPSYPLDLHLCLDCGHVQLLDVVDPVYLFDHYTYMSGNTKPLVQHFQEVADSTGERYGVRPGDLVIDVGSNDGSLLRAFQKRGAKVLGIDPAREIARRATEGGIPTLPEFLTHTLAARILRDHGPARVVCAFNVFAHADDLAGMTDSIQALLAPDGVFVCEFSYLLDILDRKLLGTIFHEHLSHHSVKPLAAFLERHGLQFIDVQRNGIQGGSIVGTAQRLGGPHPVLPSVPEILALESRVGLDQPATLRRFSDSLQDLRTRVAALVADIQAQGKRLWGYGAARSGTTLIAQMNLGRAIESIVDDGADKQNKFSPGDHIPIRPSSALLAEQPEYVIILAWIHADRIIQNNQAYLERGGRFIVCFPELRIVGDGRPTAA